VTFETNIKMNTWLFCMKITIATGFYFLIFWQTIATEIKKK